MEEKMLLAELTKNCEKNVKEVLELMKVYELAKLGREVQDQQLKDVYNRVLSENFFYASEEMKRNANIEKGDRITDEEFSFLLSKEDFDRYLSLSLPYMVEEGITDEKGYFITNWSELELRAKNELVDYLINTIIPSSMRDLFWKNRKNIVFMNRMIDALKGCIKSA